MSIEVPEECVISFRKVNTGKFANNFSIFKFAENESLAIDSPNHDDQNVNISWDELISKLPVDGCRYVLYNFNYISVTDNIERSKLVFILWSPSAANKKHKMMSAFFAQSVLDKLTAASAVSCQIQAGTTSSLEYSVVLEKVLRKLSVK